MDNIISNLWAPWRSEYVRKIDIPDEKGCFICNAVKADDDKKYMVLKRSDSSVIIMNRYPYNPGHLMVCCNDHIGDIEDVAVEVAAEMWQSICSCKSIMKSEMSPHGFNIGINQGRCAGAGVEDHLHIHIVPRWNGDSNFMSSCCGMRVVSQSIEELYDILKSKFDG